MLITLNTEFSDGAPSPRIRNAFSDVITKYTLIDSKASDANKLQRFIMQKIKSVFMTKLESGEFPQEMVTIAQCARTKHANILFHVPSMHPSFSLSTDDWNQMMPHDHLPQICPHTVCSLPLNDNNRAHHQHSCMALKSDATIRHNLILNSFFSFARACGYVCRKEPLHEQQRRHQLRLKKLKPDAVIISGNPRVAPIMLDVAVTHPCAPSVSRLQSPNKRPLAAADAVAKTKHKKYDGLAASLDQTFSALVMETYGGMHADFHSLIDSVVENARNNQQLHHREAINLKVYGYCSLAAALHRGNGLLSRRMFQISSIDDINIASASTHRRLDFLNVA